LKKDSFNTSKDLINPEIDKENTFWVRENNNFFCLFLFEKLQKQECIARIFFNTLSLFIPRQAPLAPRAIFQEPVPRANGPRA